MISPYNPKEIYTHYVKGRFAMHGSNAVLYLPKAFDIQNNDRAMAQRVFPPEGVTGDPIDISHDLVFEYTAMPPSAQYIVLRLTSTVLNSIKDTWSTANITGMRLVLDYSYAQALAVNSDVTIKTFRFVPEGANPSSNELTVLPRTDMWKMWMTDDELRLSEPSASYNNLNYILNGQYPIEWQEGVHVNAQSASPPSYSYNLLQDPVVRLSDISTTAAIYRNYTNAAYTNLTIASWNETTKKQNGDDIKPLIITSLPPFEEPTTWTLICQGIDENVEDDETLVSLEFEIFHHKQTNKVFALQDNLNLSVDYTKLYQWGTNENSNFLSLYLPSDFMTKRGSNRDIIFELLNEDSAEHDIKVFLLPSEYGKLYVNWNLYNSTFPGSSEDLRYLQYIKLAEITDGDAWQPFTYVIKTTNDKEQVIISLDKNLVNTYVNDLPCDITDLAFNSLGQYTYTDTGGYGTHQTNKRLLLQWKVKRKDGGYPYYYEKYMWQHEDQNLSKKSSCFDAIAKTGTEAVRYNKIITPITEKSKLEDGNIAYGQITITDGDVVWKYSDSSQISSISNGDITDTEKQIRTLSYKPVNNITTFFYDPQNIFVRLIYNKLINHFSKKPEDTTVVPPPSPPPPSPPPPEWNLDIGTDKNFDDSFPDLLDICKYTIPARNYKFIFTLENYNSSTRNYGYNAYRIQNHNKTFTSDLSNCTGLEGRNSNFRLHQPSGHFMYNGTVSNTTSGKTGAALFLPESFFDDSVYDEMYIAIRAPQIQKSTTAKISSTGLKTSQGYFWLRNEDIEQDSPPSDGDIVRYTTPQKHALTWSSTWTYTLKSTGKTQTGSLYPGYRVISIPQTTLDRITGGWHTDDKKDLTGLQLMISYTLKSSIFNDLNLTTKQLRQVNSRQMIVRNLVAQFYEKKENYSYMWDKVKAELINDFLFIMPKMSTLTTGWSKAFNVDNTITPGIVSSNFIDNALIILQNRYIGQPNPGYLTIQASRWKDSLLYLQLHPGGKIDYQKRLPGFYRTVDELQSSTVNMIPSLHDPLNDSLAYKWHVPNMRYPDNVDTESWYINGDTKAKTHNTAMIIYEEP